MNNNEVFEGISKLFNNLVKHIKELSEFVKDIDTAKSNVDKIKSLGVWHMENRELAKKIVAEIPNCKGNLVFSLMKDKLSKQIIIMTNLATNYQEETELALETNDEDKLLEQINQLKDYSKEIEKMNSMYSKMSKK